MDIEDLIADVRRSIETAGLEAQLAGVDPYGTTCAIGIRGVVSAMCLANQMKGVIDVNKLLNTFLDVADELDKRPKVETDG